MPAPTDAISGLLQEYNQALNASSTASVMPLYLSDGVFMPPFSPSAVGIEAVSQAYDAVFAAIQLTVKFNIVEIVEMSEDWAFARTNSEGHTLVHATGESTSEANQELFILKKDADGKFKIARYSFSTIKPQSK
jgi:uncharacterized protein (TIGR02246 family)